jgi:hypothetical protein
MPAAGTGGHAPHVELLAIRKEPVMSIAALQAANLAARFAIELAALAALAYWGFTLNATTMTRVLAGVGAPLLAAGLWAVFASPQAPVLLPAAGKIAVQVLVLGAAVVALLQAGRPALAVGFGTATGINAALLAWWQQ